MARPSPPRLARRSPERPISALPSPVARAIAFGSILLAGVLGALIGHGFMRLQCKDGCGAGPAFGAIVGAVFFAAGTAVVAVLSLRAMGEWRRIDLDPGIDLNPRVDLDQEPIIRRTKNDETS